MSPPTINRASSEPAGERVLKASFPALSGEERTAILPPAINHSADPNGDASPPSASLTSRSPAASRSSRAGEGVLSKHCAKCGKLFHKPDNNSRYAWARRKFCSLACMYNGREKRKTKKYYPLRPCEQCGKSCRPYSATSRYCSHPCRALGQIGRACSPEVQPRILKEWPAGLRFEDSPHAIRDMGSAGYGYRNTLNHSAYGCAAAMCAAGGSKSALRF